MATKYGFNVTIGADTNPFTTALKRLNAPIKEAEKDLKRISDGLTLNPGNVTLLQSQFERMGNVVGETKAKLEGLKEARDNLQKEANGKYTEEQYKALTKLNIEIATTEEELKKAQKEYNNFGSVGLQQIRVVGDKMQDVGNKIQNVGKKLMVVSTAVGGLLTTGVMYNAEIERSEKAFETFVGSAELAQEAVEKIKEQSKKSPFDTKDLISANQMLVATGISADTARDTINAMADAIALSGGGNDELKRMAGNLQQIQNAGKATAIDIRQFAYAGIDIYGVLAETTGKTTDELKDMDITFDMLSEAFQKASQEGGKYANGQVKMSETMLGSLATLKKTFLDLLGQISESLMPIITQVTQKIQGLVDWFSSLDDSQKANIGTILGIIAVAGPLMLVIGKIVSGVGELITAISTIGTAILTLKKFITTQAIPAISNAVSKVFTLIMAHPVIAIITVVIGALVLLYTKCEWFRNIVNSIVKNIYDFFVSIFTKIGEFFTKTIPSWIDKAKEVFSNLPYYIGYALGQAFIKITKFGEDALNWVFTEIPKIIENIGNWFRELPGRIGNALANALGSIGDWLGNMWSYIMNNLPGIIEGIGNYFASLPGRLLEIGGNIIEGLWNGIQNAGSWLHDKISNFAQGILDGMKDALGIHSPSVLFEKIIGKNIALGIGKGFDKNIGGVISDMNDVVGNMAYDISLPDTKASMGNITLQFYPQEMSESELNQAFNYVNRRFGMAY